MNSNTLLDILHHPNENGMAGFILGILFILSIYHFLLYFQNKDISYLLYSSYTFLVMVGHLDDPKNGFIAALADPIRTVLKSGNLNIIWLYNMIYFIFAFAFLDLKVYSMKWYRFIFRSIFILFFILLIAEIVYRISDNYSIKYYAHIFFLIYMAIVALISYIPLFKMKNPLRYYIIIGSAILLITSLSASIIEIGHLMPPNSDIGFSVFYIGVILENILFSLGLGQKQKMILNEKNASQKKLILQLQEIDSLRLKMQEQLEKDVVSLNKQAEEKKLEVLKVTYDRELANLKIASLRSQMNPHFIFNSLNSIKLYMINNDQKNAVYYLNKFSKLIRKILASTREKVVSLANEIETAELYLNIENIRFNNEIEIDIKVDESLPIDTLKIPGLILQPFLENAIWHGLFSKTGIKKLWLSVSEFNQTHILISVKDNGIGCKASTQIKQEKLHKTESLGLKITKERLDIFVRDYKNNYKLSFVDLYEDEVAIGTEVVLKLPIK